MADRLPVATFLVRVWHEEGQFRARISSSRDISADPQAETATADPATVTESMKTWLDSVLDVQDQSSPCADLPASDHRT
jgi:hypothetical protein